MFLAKQIVAPSLTLIVVSIFPELALAEKTTLICPMTPVENFYIESLAEPTTVEFDEPQGTVVVHRGPLHGSLGEFPAQTSTYPARFTSETISWTDSLWGSAWTINRLTGNMTNYTREGKPSNWLWRCRTGNKVF